MEPEEGQTSGSSPLVSVASHAEAASEESGRESAAPSAAGDTMTKEHAAAFKKVMEKRRIIWCDYAAAFQAALECVHTKQSQDFCTKFIPKHFSCLATIFHETKMEGVSGTAYVLWGGRPPIYTVWTHAAACRKRMGRLVRRDEVCLTAVCCLIPKMGHNLESDEWEHRRKGNHPAEDQTKYFQTTLLCAVKLVLAALDRGCAELVDALDMVLDPTSPIFHFYREPNKVAYQQAQALHHECVRIWREGGGPAKRLMLLEKAPWHSLLSIVKNVETQHEGADVADILNRVALRVEKASSKEIADAGKNCIQLIQYLRKEKEVGSGGSSGGLLGGLFKSDPKKQLKKRLKAALRNLALQGTKSSVWAQRKSALDFLEHVIKNDKEYKQSSGQAMCLWLDEHQVIEDLFGERAHSTIVSETVSLLSLIDLTESRLSVILDAAFMHVGSVRAEVHKVILALLKDLDKNRTRFILDRIMDVFDVPAPLKPDPESTPITHVASNSSISALASLQRTGSNKLQAGFELVTAIFDTSKLHGLYTTVDVMMKGKKIAMRAMDVLVAALLTPFCEDQEVFSRLVQDSLFHCLQSSWGEVDGKGQGKSCKEYVAELCCNIVKNPETAPRAVKGAFAVLNEVIRLFPRTNFAQRGDKTREECIHGLQKQFDVLQACLSNLKTLSAGLDKKIMDSDKVLDTELWTRLLQLRYLLENCTEKQYNLTLDRRQVDMLWEALGGPTEACLRWLRLAADSGGIFEENVERYLYTEYICKMNAAKLRPHGFNCYQAFFGDVNISTGALQAAGRDGQKSGCKINGAAFVGRRVRVLWKDEKMHNGTICTYMPPTSRSPRTQQHTVRWDDTGKEDTHDWTDLHDWHLLEDELSVNILPYEIKSVVKPDDLIGHDFLWAACIESVDDAVASKAADMLLDLSRFMPQSFRDDILNKIFGSPTSPTVRAVLGRSQGDDTSLIRTKRGLELLINFLRGQLRVCDNVFSCRQLMQSRAHGFQGRGKNCTVTLSLKDETYKSAPKQVKVHTRMALDDVLREAYPQIAQGTEASRIVVSMNNVRLVRGPQTTLEELRVPHQAEFKLEASNMASPVPPIGSMGDAISSNSSFYEVLFNLMEEGDSNIQVLVWDVLMALPTSTQDIARVGGHAGPWTEAVCNQASLWRSLYILQILDSQLCPHYVDAGSLQDSALFRRNFVQNNGLQAVVSVMLTAMEVLGKLNSANSKHLNALLRDTGFPIILRVLKFCLVLDEANAAPWIGVSLQQSGEMWNVISLVTKAIILLDHSDRGPSPTPSSVDAIVDGFAVTRALLRSSAGGSALDANSLSKFFSPKNQQDLATLGLVNQSAIQVASKMSSDAGILINKLLLNYPDSHVRQAVAEVFADMASMSAEWGRRVVELMSECLTVAQNQCTTCKQFFLLLSRLLLSNPDGIKDQIAQVHKATMLATTLLQSADKLVLSNEIMLELITLVHNVLQRAVLPHADLVKISDQLVSKLYKDFLMRVPTHTGTSARRLMNRHSLGGNNHLQVAPLCDTPETRQAAWSLLLTCITRYSTGHVKSMMDAVADFTERTRLPIKISWNRLNSSPKEDWEHKATVERRKLACVGLKNQGATCYMNAMMQELFLDDTLRKCILTAPLAPPPPEKSEEMWRCSICTLENDWSSRICCVCEQGERPEKVDPVAHGELLRQLQRTFRFMVDSELQSFDPIQFVEACRDLGLHFRVTSQNDSMEFFDKLLERLEREVGGKTHSEVLKSCFRVRVSSQLVSVECSHRKPINAGVYEKSFKVNVERMGTLERAIQETLAGELMTGDSRVDCEVCTAAAQAQGAEGVVKKAMKKTLFFDRASMPKTLCVQLNRFQFQANGTCVKLNDRLAFPMVLDLAPFTKPPKVEHEHGNEDDAMGEDMDFDMENVDETEDIGSLMYELKGIVVHSGQFSFGHYYSFAQDPISGKWLKLDDDLVSEFDLADLESECFGGIQTTVNKWTNCVYKTEKTASAYMLFYQRKDQPVPTPQKEGRSDSISAGADSGMDPSSELSDIDKLSVGEGGSTPSALESAAGVDEILDTNEQMIRRSLLFDDGFSGFVLELVSAMEASGDPNAITLDVFKTVMSVMYKSVMHSESHPRMLPSGGKANDWLSTVSRLLRSPACSLWLLEQSIKMGGEPDNLPCWLEGGLVTCPIDEVRHTFAILIKSAIACVCQAQSKGNAAMHVLDDVVEILNNLVPTVSHHWRHMAQFGEVLETVALQGERYIDLLRERDTLAMLLHLYLGPKSPGIKDVAKLGAMGVANTWPGNGRTEPDFDAILRTCSMLMQGATKGNTTRLPRLSENMVTASIRQTASKLIECEAMGGSTVLEGGDVEPLLLEICMRAESRNLFDVGHNLVVQLEKQCQDPIMRMRQSQCAQFLCRFLYRVVAPGKHCVWSARETDLNEICEQVVGYVLQQFRSDPSPQDRYNAGRNLLVMKRFAQLLVMLGHINVTSLLQPHSETIGVVSAEVAEMMRGRPISNTNDAADQELSDSLKLIEESLVCCRQVGLPSEVYVCGGSGDFSVVNGVYRMEPQASQSSMNQQDWSMSPSYVKQCEKAVSLAISKSISQLESSSSSSSAPSLQEFWEISHMTSAGHPVRVMRTAATAASHQRVPPMHAVWMREAYGGSGENVSDSCTLQILGQWNEELPQIFRNRGDYAGLSGGSGIDISPHMDIANPTGGSRHVRFGGGDDDRNSDSASDEAIAGSDQEGDEGVR